MLFKKKRKKSVKSINKSPTPKPQQRPLHFKPPEYPKVEFPKYEKAKKADEKGEDVNKPKKKSEEYKQSFIKTFNELSYRHNAWQVWNDFIFMAACAISNAVDKAHFEEREKQYLSVAKKYSKEEGVLFPKMLSYVVMALELNPNQDFLGSIFMALGLGNKNSGQFFTPYHICELMAEITMDGIAERVKKDGYVSINDCCCGAGATLIAASNVARRKLYKENLNFQNHICIVGQDIDQMVGLMCYIQISLLGMAGYVKIGNALTEPIEEDDDKTNHWYTPMYFSDVWAMRRFIHSLSYEPNVNSSIDISKGERKEEK